MKVVFVTVSAPAVRSLMAAARILRDRYRDVALDLKLYYVAVEFSAEKRAQLTEGIAGAAWVFVDLMGCAPPVAEAVYAGLKRCGGHIVPLGTGGREYLRLGKFTADSMQGEKAKGERADRGGSAQSGGEAPRPAMSPEGLRKMQDMAEKMGKFFPGKLRDMRNYTRIVRYFQTADRENGLNLLILILREYGGYSALPKPGDPHEVAETQICDPAKGIFYADFSAYARDFPFQPDKPLIALLFYARPYPMDTWPVVTALKHRLEEEANVLSIAIADTFGAALDQLRSCFLPAVPRRPDLIINLMSFRLGAGPMGGKAEEGVELLQETGALYFHPYLMSRRTEREWLEAGQGSVATDVLISVMLPELDGCLETYPVAAKTEPVYDRDFDVDIDELALISERADRLLARVGKYLRLREKPNAEKRIAVIGYDYPPGESHLLGGAFLDTLASIVAILERLYQEGYSISPLSRENLLEIFAPGRAVNSSRYDREWAGMIKYDRKKYARALAGFSRGRELAEQWGEAPGQIMTDDEGDFMIPGVVRQNVFIGLQPARGPEPGDDRSYHDRATAPHHQYMAFYQWLREEFRADAVIHVGTHGTLEFLPGKECGMSGSCYPDWLIGDLPHIYLYYCGNPSEAVIAKRRTYANLVSYQPPLFVPGELYGEYARLRELMDEYRQSLSLFPQSSAEIREKVRQLAASLNLPEEMAELERELYRMETALIPQGLHVFGTGFTPEQAEEYALSLLRYSRNGVSSLRQSVAEAQGFKLEDWEDQGDYDKIKECDRIGAEIYRHYQQSRTIPDYPWLKADLRAKLEETCAYGRKAAENAGKNGEMTGLLCALAGRYNRAKLAGDIYRSPEVLPAGENLYQFDPRLVPSATACARGMRVCAGTLERYRQEHGAYPRAAAVILWGLETSQTQGETFAQILAYLGVRRLAQKGLWNPDYELIPLPELGRPRIDVTVNICGFFRDMFPNLIDSLDDIFKLVCAAPEKDEENYVKAHARALYRKLQAEGYGEDEAEELARTRIFGPEEGSYGTGLTDIIQRKNWREEEELGTVFTASLSYAYSRTMHGRGVKDLYQENLKSVELISQIRNNQEYEITDLDHYYEFFGGLAKSVEMVRGRQAKMYITDTTGDRPLTESVEQAVAQGIRTRVLNPKWIEGLLAHPRHGGQKIADRLENVLGLAATTHGVEAWIYDDLHKCYVADEQMRQKLADNNPHAYLEMLEQMMEYKERGYWQATPEQIEQIKAAYLEVENRLEESI